MLRPDHVIEYFKSRAKLQLSDHETLIKGANLGTTVVVGGGEINKQRFGAEAAKHGALTMCATVNGMDPKSIDVKRTIVFDLTAVAQLLMIAKNEAFHQTATQCISMLQKTVVEGDQTIEDGLLALRELADQIDPL